MAHCFVHLWLRVCGQRVYERIAKGKEWGWGGVKKGRGQRGAKDRKKIENRMGMRAKR